MGNTLFISYDLNVPGQAYEAVIAEIKSLGSWAKVQQSFWFVDSSLSAKEARDRVAAKMDTRDSLVVVDVTNQSGAWIGVSDTVSKHMLEHWNRKQYA